MDFIITKLFDKKMEYKVKALHILVLLKKIEFKKMTSNVA